MSTSSGAVSSSTPPTACAIRPQFGSPPCSAALTSGELATARAAAFDRRLVAAVDHHAPDALRPLAVAHDQQREPPQDRRPAPRRSAARRRTRAAIRTPAGAARHQDRGVVGRELAVDRDAVERALHAHAEQQIGGLGRERRVGLHEAQHRREVGRDHPRALGLRGDADRAARQRHVDRTRAWGTGRWCGSPRRTRSSPSGCSSPRAARIPLRDRLVGQLHADHAGRGDGDHLGVEPDRHRGGALHAGGVVDAAPAGGGVGVAGVGDHRAQRVEPAALLAQDHRRGEHARAGEARGAHGPDRVGDEQARCRRRRSA